MIKFKRGSQAEWASKNLTLGDGQPGLVRMSDGNYALKIGNGSSTYSLLQFLSAMPLVQTLSNFSWDYLTTAPGLYVVTSGSSGTAPGATFPYGLLVIHNGGFYTQVAFAESEVLGCTVQVRTFSGSKWNKWVWLLTSNSPVSSFADVSKITKAGQAKDVFNIGDQFSCNHGDFGTLTWDIIGIDHDTSDASTHSITIQTHDVLPGLNAVFDAKEPSNTDSNRKSYGRNLWTPSNLRQWLNSEKDSPWFSAYDSYDAAGTGGIFDKPGFLKNLDPDLKGVLGKVSKPTLQEYNTTTLIQGTDTMFCLSLAEVYGGLGGSKALEGTPYEYYSKNSSLSAADTSADNNRIKTKDGNASIWWLRTPYGSNSYGTYYVYSGGTCDSSIAYGSRGVAPACCIV